MNDIGQSMLLQGAEYTSIHAGILFADLEHSVLLSATSDPAEYQQLVNDYQAVMLRLVALLKEQGLPVAEYSVRGDELAIFFYDHAEVEDNYRLDGPDALQGEEREAVIAGCRKRNAEVAFAPLKAAILLKNMWLVQGFNLKRVQVRRQPLALGIGIHYGRVHLMERPDGQRRIEGYAVNLAKRIEGYSRQGSYSHIMLSREAHDFVRGSVRRHTMLRQRIFFHEHKVSLELLKGITQGQHIYELKFFSRIGIAITPEVAEQYEVLFAIDHQNVWAYYQLFEYYAYQQQDWQRVYELAKKAYLAYPNDEKVMLDLSRYAFQSGSLDQAQRMADHALEVNPQFDLVYEHLAVMAGAHGDLVRQREYLSRALSLTPGSPVNHLNLGITLCELGVREEGEQNILEALRMYPDYIQDEITVGLLEGLALQNKLSPAVTKYLNPAAS